MALGGDIIPTMCLSGFTEGLVPSDRAGYSFRPKFPKSGLESHPVVGNHLKTQSQYKTHPPTFMTWCTGVSLVALLQMWCPSSKPEGPLLKECICSVINLVYL